MQLTRTLALHHAQTLLTHELAHPRPPLLTDAMGWEPAASARQAHEEDHDRAPVAQGREERGVDVEVRDDQGPRAGRCGDVEAKS
eukprot:1128454-Rhodomonas_salina.2